MCASDGAVSAGMVLNHERESAVEPKKSCPRPSSPNSCIISQVSTPLWQLVKTWEMMQEFGLEGRGHDFFGSTADSRSWFNTIPADTAPSEAHIPDGAAGAGGSALTNEYLSASWYELQILLNNGNHQHRDRGPVDWVYLIGRYRDLIYPIHGAPVPLRSEEHTSELQSPDHLVC